MPRVCLLAIVLALGCHNTDVTPPPGDVASALALPTLAGDAFDPATLRGRPTLVLFWRVGCSYCMHELPIVSQIAHEHGVAAVAVMVAGDKARATDAIKGFDGPVLVDDGTLRKQYAINSVPYLVVLRGDGTAARAYLGEQSEDTISDSLDGLN